MASSERAAPAGAAEAASDKTLRLTRVFDAPIAMVFEAWTVPEQIVQWWGPEGCHVPEYRIDTRPGGAWRKERQRKKKKQGEGQNRENRGRAGGIRFQRASHRAPPEKNEAGSRPKEAESGARPGRHHGE